MLDLHCIPDPPPPTSPYDYSLTSSMKRNSVSSYVHTHRCLGDEQPTLWKLVPNPAAGPGRFHILLSSGDRGLTCHDSCHDRNNQVITHRYACIFDVPVVAI